MPMCPFLSKSPSKFNSVSMVMVGCTHFHYHLHMWVSNSCSHVCLSVCLCVCSGYKYFELLKLRMTLRLNGALGLFQMTFWLQTGVSLSYVLWALSHNFTIFVVARIIGGISKGNVSISTAVVADVLPPEKRGKGMVSTGKLILGGHSIGWSNPYPMRREARTW